MSLTKFVDGDLVEMTAEEEAEFLAMQAALPSVISPAIAIKAEARRRILLVMTEDQQRNTLAAGQAAMMEFGPDPSNWPEDLRARHAAAILAWAEIERLRARSNVIEALTPMPADLTDDALWAAP